MKFNVPVSNSVYCIPISCLFYTVLCRIVVRPSTGIGSSSEVFVSNLIELGYWKADKVAHKQPPPITLTWWTPVLQSTVEHWQVNCWVLLRNNYLWHCGCLKLSPVYSYALRGKHNKGGWKCGNGNHVTLKLGVSCIVNSVETSIDDIWKGMPMTGSKNVTYCFCSWLHSVEVVYPIVPLYMPASMACQT